MSENRSYNVNIPELLASLGICSSVREIVPLSGGHLHRMYAVTPENGEKLAVKALNPGVMARPEAMRNFIVSEEIASLAARVVPAVPARRFDGRAVQESDGQFYLIYDFIDGEPLYDYRLPGDACPKMGSILYRLHRLDVSSVEFPEESVEVPEPRDWTAYLSRDAAWYTALTACIDKLYEWDERCRRAQSRLRKTAVSHRDLEPKNVLWCGGEPRIIDWEAAGKVDPWYDLFENAVYWAKDADGDINWMRFTGFIGGYVGNLEKYPSVDWNIVADAGFGLLDWLEYNLKRSLGIECADEAERRLGTEQVSETLKTLDRYDRSVPVLIRWAQETVDFYW